MLVIIAICGVTIHRCSGAWVWLIIILAIVSCTGLFLCFLHLFTSIYPTCFCTFYTCSTLYLLFLYGLVFNNLTAENSQNSPLSMLQIAETKLQCRKTLPNLAIPLCCDLHSISCYCSLCTQTAAWLHCCYN